MIEKKQKVLVALSGGVDSSVAAALLKQQGYEVVGIHFLFCQKKGAEAEKMAREVCKKLGIRFLVVDLRKEFAKTVMDYFVKEYLAGRTPNPCVICNKEMKFKCLLDLAKKHKADFVATGHYARLWREIPNSKLQAPNKFQILNSKQNIKILRPKDENKDQTYFLWKLGQKELSKIIFPIGEYEKTEVRKIAQEMSLPTAQAPESNDVCFLKNTNIYEFLSSRIYIYPEGCPRSAGKIVGVKGRVLAEHQGLWRYTIGQRKGINISVKKGRAALPYFVVAKNIEKNELVVSQDENDLLQKELVAEKVNWVSGVAPRLPLRVQAKIRYRTPSASAVVKRISSGKYKVFFAKSQRAITPGQSVVFYNRNELFGGGIIQ